MKVHWESRRRQTPSSRWSLVLPWHPPCSRSDLYPALISGPAMCQGGRSLEAAISVNSAAAPRCSHHDGQMCTTSGGFLFPSFWLLPLLCTDEVKGRPARSSITTPSLLPIAVTSLPVAVSHLTTSDSVRIVKGSWQNARHMVEYERVSYCDLERSLPL